MKTSTITWFIGWLIILGPGLSGAAADGQVQALAPACIAVSALSDGEVRRVNANTQKITLQHGEIKSLDMPSMTMVFQVKDPAMLDKVKPGDKVRFTAEKISGAFTVTTLKVVE